MKLRAYWPILLAVGLASAVYLPRLSAPLAWDDYGTLVLNARLGSRLPLADFFRPAYFDFSREQSWRPMATFSYAVLTRIAGKSPKALRGAMLLLHLANALLLAVLVRSCGLPAGPALWAAALFLLHPAHTETLMCVAFNEEILCALGLLALLLFHRRRWTAPACAALAFAALSKESGVLGLPLVLLFDCFQEGSPRGMRERWREYGAYGLVLGAYLWLRFIQLPAPASGIGPDIPPPLRERLYQASNAFLTAWKVLLWPVDLRLEYFALPPDSSLEWLGSIGLSLLVAVFLGRAIGRLWRQDRSIACFAAWPIPFLLLTSNLLPSPLLNMRMMAERWLYLPFLGAAAALSPWAHRRAATACAVLLCWGAAGFARTLEWEEEPKLWASLLRVYPWCAKAYEGLGEAHFRRGEHSLALAAFQEALRTRRERRDKVLAHYAAPAHHGSLSWESPSLYRWLGHSNVKLGRLDAAEDYFSRAAGLDPADGFTYRIMSYSLASGGRFLEARRWLDRGLSANPADSFLLKLRPDLLRRELTWKAEFN